VKQSPLSRVREGSPAAHGAIWMEKEQTSPFFPPMRPRLKCACSTRPAAKRRSAWCSPNIPIKLGTATFRMFIPVLSMAIASRDLTSHSRVTALIPTKLLLDPHARARIGDLKWAPECFGYTIGAEGEDLTFDKRDSAPPCLPLRKRLLPSHSLTVIRLQAVQQII
jgi:hypothetical protein